MNKTIGWLLGIGWMLSGCADDRSTSADAGPPVSGEVVDATVAPTPDTGTLDTTTDVATPPVSDAVTDADRGPLADAIEDGGSSDGGSEDATDTGADGGGVLPELRLRSPLGPAPESVLAGSETESCAIYLEERCQGEAAQRCGVYDGALGAFVEPLPQLKRLLLYDRWYDLYHQPDGQTCERHFVGETLAGTPESEWGSLDHFGSFGGAGDSAIWTGVSLVSAVARYMATGTEADYLRMETKVRRLLTLFDVTGIPGYLARYHMLVLPPGAPKSDQHILRYGDGAIDDHRDHIVDDPSIIALLPSIYSEGIADETGQIWEGVVQWHGNPSIDQYTGPMVAFPLVYDLLTDDALRDAIAHHLTCYLKRLRRLEIRNLQQNPDALEAIQGYFAGGVLQLDPGDVDFSTLDTVVAYVNLQVNSLNAETFDTSCPDTVALEPYRVLDATAPTFIFDVVALAGDLQSSTNESAGGIDHAYVPSVRGGDAMHMMHLAALAYRFTGDEMYRTFLFDELIGNIGTIPVAHTMGALVFPRWCRSFYGAHITFSPLWAFLLELDASPLRDELERVMEEEIWTKEMANQGNAKLEIMYASTVSDAIATGKVQALDHATQALAELGGNGGVLDDPRRTYTLDPAWLIGNMPAGNEPVCPTEEERALCEDGIDVLGITIPGESITSPCTGAVLECPVGEGCARMMALDAMPMVYRVWEDFLWQRNPFKLGAVHGPEGHRQSPGLDLTETYWLARHFGFIEEGQGQALAWEDLGSCE